VQGEEESPVIMREEKAMSTAVALGSGLVGACALTAAHQLARGTLRDAPRMDVLGERAIVKTAAAVGLPAPSAGQLYPAALAGDVVANSLYYSLVGAASRESALACGALLGLVAGIGAVALPGPLGLGTDASARTTTTAALTVGLYLLGGLAAGLAYSSLAPARAECTGGVGG
jgi:hypothetical protein